MNPRVFVAVLLAAGCREPARIEPQTPLPAIEIAGGSSWELARTGTDPALRTRDGALWIFLSSGGADRPLAGLAFGDARGPKLGLLGGELAPLIAAPRSDRAYTITATASGELAHVRFSSDGRQIFAASISPPHDGRASTRIHGTAVILIPADRTELRASAKGAPTSGFTITAGEKGEVLLPHADRLEVKTKKLGALVIEASCARPRVIRPIPKGSTSVFLVFYGPSLDADDPLFGVAGPSPLTGERCTATVTSTLSLSWPPPT